jgi:hypothetical protein
MDAFEGVSIVNQLEENLTDFIAGGANQSYMHNLLYGDMMEGQCSSWCANKIATMQIDALNGIRERFSGFLIAIVVYLIVNVILDKILYSDEKGEFKILKKSIPFKLDPNVRKIIIFGKNTAMYAILGMALIYLLLNPVIQIKG